jgi:hypothetical protein
VYDKRGIEEVLSLIYYNYNYFYVTQQLSQQASVPTKGRRDKEEEMKEEERRKKEEGRRKTEKRRVEKEGEWGKFFSHHHPSKQIFFASSFFRGEENHGRARCRLSFGCGDVVDHFRRLPRNIHIFSSSSYGNQHIYSRYAEERQLRNSGERSDLFRFIFCGGEIMKSTGIRSSVVWETLGHAWLLCYNPIRSNVLWDQHYSVSIAMVPPLTAYFCCFFYICCLF